MWISLAWIYLHSHVNLSKLRIVPTLLKILELCSEILIANSPLFRIRRLRLTHLLVRPVLGILSGLNMIDGTKVNRMLRIMTFFFRIKLAFVSSLFPHFRILSLSNLTLTAFKKLADNWLCLDLGYFRQSIIFIFTLFCQASFQLLVERSSIVYDWFFIIFLIEFEWLLVFSVILIY